MPIVANRPLCATTEDELSLKTFAHIHNDVRLLGTKLQGNKYSDSISYLLLFMKYLQTHDVAIPEKEKQIILQTLVNAEPTFQELIDIEEKIQTTHMELALSVSASNTQYQHSHRYINSNDIINKQVNDEILSLATSISSKLIGNHKKLFIPGGWVDHPSGHAMAFEFERLPNGDYQFFVYNTGAGIDTHKKKSSKKNYYAPLKAYVIPYGPSAHQINEFIKTLLEPLIRPNLEKPAYKSYDETVLYKIITDGINNLGGKELDPTGFFDEYILAQFSGVCSMRVLMSILQRGAKGDIRAFKLYLYQLELQSMLDLYTREKHNLADPAIHRQLQSALEQFARSTRELMTTPADNPIISANEAENNNAFIQLILDDLNHHPIQYKDRGEKNLTAILLKTRESGFYQFHNTNFKPYFLMPAYLRLNAYKPEPRNISTRAPNQSLVNYLETCNSVCMHNDRLLLSDKLLRDIEQLFLSLPITYISSDYSKSAKEYWSELKKEDARQSLDYIQNIIHLYGKHCYFKGGDPLPKRVVTALTGLLITTYIAEQYFEGDTNFSYLADYLNADNHFTHKKWKIRDPYWVTTDPEFDNRVVEVNEQFCNLTNTDTQFGITSFPKLNLRPANDHCAAEDFYDVQLIEKYGLKELLTKIGKWNIKLKEHSELDFARCTLYKLMNQELYVTIDLSEDEAKSLSAIKSDFDFCVQFHENYQQCLLFENGQFDYFKNSLPDKTIRNKGCDYHELSYSRTVYREPFIHAPEDSWVQFNDGVTKRVNAHLKRTLPETLNMETTFINNLMFDRRIDSDESNLMETRDEHPEYSFDSNKMILAANHPLHHTLPFTRLRQTEIRIITTLDFFRQNMEYLNKRDYQTLFLFNIMTPNLLHKALLSNPYLTDDLVEFVRVGVRRYSNESKLEPAAAFCFQIAGLLYRNFKTFDVTKIENADRAIIQNSLTKLALMTDDLTRLISSARRYQEDTKLQELSRLYLYISVMSVNESSQLNPDQLQMIFDTAFLRKGRPGQNLLTDGALFKDDLNNLMQEKEKLLSQQFKTLTPSQQKSLIAQIFDQYPFNKIFPGIDKNCEMQLTFPTFNIKTKNNDEIIVDIISGKMRSKLFTVDYVSEEFYDQQFVQLFGNHLILAKTYMESDTKVCLFSRLGHDYRIIRSESKKDDADTTVGVVHIQMAIRCDNQFRWFELYSNNDVIKNIDLNKYPSHLLEHGRLFWGDMANTNFVITDSQGNCIAKLTSAYARQYDLRELMPDGSETGYRLCLSESDQERLLSDMHYNLYDAFSYFESGRFIEIWELSPLAASKAIDEITFLEQKTHESVGIAEESQYKIRFPRYNLSFIMKHLDGEWVIVSENNDQDKLLYANRPGLPEFDNALIIERMTELGKERQCLLPSQAFDCNSQPIDEYHGIHLDTHHSIPNLIVEGQSNQSWKYTQNEKYYTIKLNENNEFMPVTPVEYLYIAYICLAKHECQKAYYYLLACEKMGGLKGSSEEADIIHKIMLNTPNSKCKDYQTYRVSDPETEAVRLQAAYLFGDLIMRHFGFALPTETNTHLKNGNDTYQVIQKQTLDSFIKSIYYNTAIASYGYYLQAKEHVPKNLRLGQNKERLLIQAIFRMVTRDNLPVQVLNRYRNLKELSLVKRLRTLSKLEVKNANLDTRLKEKLLRNLAHTETLDYEVKEHKLSTLPEFKLDFIKHLFKAKKPVDLMTLLEVKLPIIEEKTVDMSIQLIDPKISTEPFVQKEIEIFNKDYNEGARLNQIDEMQNKGFVSYFSDPAQRNRIASKINELNISTRNLTQTKETLIRQVNIHLQGDLTVLDTHLAILGKEMHHITWDQLLILYLQNDIRGLCNATLLSETEAKQLLDDVHVFLLEATEEQQRKRVEKQLDEINKLKPGTSEYESALITLGEIVTSKQYYDADKHPELLLFEYIDNKRLRQSQVAVIEKMTESKGPEHGYKNQVIQLIMGGGKTKILLPILALKQATGLNLSILFLPAATFNANFADLQNKTVNAFGKMGFPFLFSREMDCSSLHLKSIYKKFKSIIAERQYLMTTAQSLEALELKYIDILKAKSIDKDAPLQIKYLEKLLVMLRTQGDGIVDEVDSTLETKKELNYSLGKEKEGKAEYRETSLNLYNLFELVKIPNSQLTLQDVFLNESMIDPSNWDAILANFADVLLNNTASPFHNTFNDAALTIQQKNELKEFLLGKSNQATLWIDETFSHDHKELLYLTKGVLDLIKLTLSKRAKVNYGFPDTDSASVNPETSVPFIANNKPSKRTQQGGDEKTKKVSYALHGTYFESLLYSIQLHLNPKKLLSENTIIEFIRDYSERAKKITEESSGKIPFDSTFCALEFMRLTGFKLGAIDISNANHISQLQQRWSKDQKVRDFCLTNYVLKKIKTHPEIARSNGVYFVKMLRSTLGVTGTPYNAGCLHTSLPFDRQQGFGVDGRTINLFINKCDKNSIHLSKGESLIDRVADIYHNHPRKNDIHALIDVDAHQKGVDNFETAKQLMNKLNEEKSPNQSFLYFDDNDNLCTWNGEKSKEIIQTEPEVIERRTGVKPEQRFTYYDQLRTTGTDILQADNAIALVTLGKNSMLRDVTQGEKRMRGFHRGQGIEVILSQELATDLQDKEKKLEPNALDITKKIVLNQINTLDGLHFQAAIQELNCIIRNDLLLRLYSANDYATKITLMSHFEDAFIIKNITDPITQFAGIEQEKPTRAILVEMQEAYFKKWSDMVTAANIFTDKNDFDAAAEVILQQLKDNIEARIDRCFVMRKAIVTKASTILDNTGLSVEAIQEQDVDTDKDKDQDKDKNKQKEKEEEKESQHQNRHETPAIRTTWTARNISDLQSAFYFKSSSSYSPELDFKPANELLSAFPAEAKILEIDSALNVSNNYLETVNSQMNPIDTHRKPINAFLVLLHPEQNQINAIILTQEDVEYWMKILTIYSQAHATLRVCLATTQDTVMWGDRTIVTHPLYKNIRGQIAFLTGDVDVLANTFNETPWIQTHTQEKLDFLETVILLNFPEKEKYFSLLKQKLQVHTVVPHLHELTEAIQRNDNNAILTILTNSIMKENDKQIILLLSSLYQESVIYDYLLALRNKAITKTLRQFITMVPNAAEILSTKMAVTTEEKSMSRTDNQSFKTDMDVIMASHNPTPALDYLSDYEEDFPAKDDIDKWRLYFKVSIEQGSYLTRKFLWYFDNLKSGTLQKQLFANGELITLAVISANQDNVSSLLDLKWIPDEHKTVDYLLSQHQALHDEAKLKNLLQSLLHHELIMDSKKPMAHYAMLLLDFVKERLRDIQTRINKPVNIIDLITTLGHKDNYFRKCFYLKAILAFGFNKLLKLHDYNHASEFNRILDIILADNISHTHVITPHHRHMIMHCHQIYYANKNAYFKRGDNIATCEFTPYELKAEEKYISLFEYEKEQLLKTNQNQPIFAAIQKSNGEIYDTSDSTWRDIILLFIQLLSLRNHKPDDQNNFVLIFNKKLDMVAGSNEQVSKLLWRYWVLPDNTGSTLLASLLNHKDISVDAKILFLNKTIFEREEVKNSGEDILRQTVERLAADVDPQIKEFIRNKLPKESLYSKQSAALFTEVKDEKAVAAASQTQQPKKDI